MITLTNEIRKKPAESYAIELTEERMPSTVKDIIEMHDTSKLTRQPPIDDKLSCDVCGATVGYDVKHFSSSTNPHIHICDECIEKYRYDRFFIDKGIIELHEANKPKPYSGERIICAAIKHNDHGIFCGYRHGKCINQAGKYYHNTDSDKAWQQGFITTDNGRFVTRGEAWAIADAAGQIINRDQAIINTLFSENLY